MWVVTKRVGLGRLSPVMTALALLAWASSVWLSRGKRLDEWTQMALHEPGWVPGSQIGSALRLLSRSLLEPLLGVSVLMTCPSVKASPCQWKCASRSPGGAGGA